MSTPSTSGPGRQSVTVELNTAQAAELEQLVRSALQDLSYEIAATENSQYRATLLQRRRRLQEILGVLPAWARTG